MGVASGTDAWGFRLGSRSSFLMACIEEGNTSKNAIQEQFLQAFPESAGKSTFAIFFSDVVRPFGSASVSRDIRLTTDVAGNIVMDQERAEIIKTALSRGMLAELTAIDRGVYPKKDWAAIHRTLEQYGLPHS